MMFEGRVILELLACKTVSGASDLMRITWDEAQGIMIRAVSRGLMRREEVEMPYLAADEKKVMAEAAKNLLLFSWISSAGLFTGLLLVDRNSA